MQGFWRLYESSVSQRGRRKSAPKEDIVIPGAHPNYLFNENYLITGSLMVELVPSA